jgi:hypothetical protein
MLRCKPSPNALSCLPVCLQGIRHPFPTLHFLYLYTSLLTAYLPISLRHGDITGNCFTVCFLPQHYLSTKFLFTSRRINKGFASPFPSYQDQQGLHFPVSKLPRLVLPAVFALLKTQGSASPWNASTRDLLPRFQTTFHIFIPRYLPFTKATFRLDTTLYRVSLRYPGLKRQHRSMQVAHKCVSPIPISHGGDYLSA